MENDIKIKTPNSYKKIGHYIIETIIGKGSFSQVYRGIDEKSNDFVAIKITSKETIIKQPQLKHLIQAEVNILNQCNNDNVVKLIDYIETNLSCYIIMEYCNEGDLRNYIKIKNHLSELEAVSFLKQLLNGFKGLHEVNAIHRDFKSANVLRKDGILKIGDLGFGKQSDYASTCLGTSIYMAPEVLKNHTYTNKADIWSLGVVYYEMLFGCFPYYAKNDKEILYLIENNPLDLKKFNIIISDDSIDLLLHIFVIDPEKRIEWTEIYNHKLFKSEDKKDNNDISGNLGNVINTYDINDLHKNIEEEKSIMKKNKQFYKTLQNNNTKNKVKNEDSEPEDNDESGVIGKVLLYSKHNSFIALDKKKEEFCREESYDSKHPFYSEMNKFIKNREEIEFMNIQIKKMIGFYMHKRNIYAYIGKTIFNSLMLQANNMDAHYANFILAKNILNLSNILINSLIEKNNVFSLEYFQNFSNSKEIENLKKFLIEENEYFNNFYDIIVEDTNRVLLKNNVLNDEIIVQLDKNKNTHPNFQNLYKQILFDYYLATYNNALKEEESNEMVAIKLFKHCYEILDCLVIEEIFPFALKDLKGNEIFFDFKKYNQVYESLSLDEIKKAIEIKFENSLKNIND